MIIDPEDRREMLKDEYYSSTDRKTRSDEEAEKRNLIDDFNGRFK
jgi:hypothetical protein